KIVKPLKKVLRLADDIDKRKVAENKKKAEEAFKLCEKKVLEHKLDMKLVEVEYAFDGSKILFYFTSDGRVDFRDLVKDLASSFHTRIELRQIGVRDEAKMLGGLGICGQPFCCNRFLDDFQPVSIKMAKEQGLSLNPTKISGSCGRLMCCLNYEQEAYEYLNSITPPVGSYVKTASGNGTVIDENPLTGMLYIKLGDEGAPIKLHRSEVELLSRGKNKKPAQKPQNAEE
ncbi:MAG: stage 0 sporulation family protein, partial [Clostridia bacterium]|nr:stage 0 sporulation family protein [Clostridia bacterium]